MQAVLFFMMFWGVLTLTLIAMNIGFPGFKLTRIPKTDSLSHNAITTLLTQLGHPEFDGVCYGFTLNWALAVAEGKEKEALFYRQISLLRAHQSDLPAILEQIEQKKQNNEQLSSEEELIETLPDLCRRICIAQDPLVYKETYGKLVWQPDITTILQTIDTDASSIRQIFYKTHTFSSRQEAVDYFNVLRKTGISSDVAVVISTADHAMGFRRIRNSWLFLNINDLYQQQKDKPYFKFTSKELVQELYRVSTAGPLTRRLTVNTDFIALKPNQQLSVVLDNKFPVFPVGLKTTYREKVSFMALAALQGDIPTVKKCIRSGWSIFSRHQISDDSPILTAIYLGRREVVRAMISPIQHRINQRRKKDGMTLLHMACKYGGSGIVEDLLNIKGIDIDLKDKEGMTPLMYACESIDIAVEEKLFRLLLDKGASLTIKDKQGLTARDHADKNNHSLAIRMIEEKVQSDAVSTLAQVQSTAYSPMAFFRRSHKEAVIASSQYNYGRH